MGPLIRSAGRYAVAIGAVLLAFVLRQVFYGATGIHVGPFFALGPAVILSALLFGFWPGISAGFLATLLAYSGISLPLGSASGNTPPDRVSLIVFSLASLIFCLFTERFRKARDVSLHAFSPSSEFGQLATSLAVRMEGILSAGPRSDASGISTTAKNRMLLLLLRIYIALAASAGGLLLRAALFQLFGFDFPPYLTFFPALLAAALVGGFWCGWLTTGFCTLYAWVWIFPPEGSFRIENPENAVSLVLFFIIGTAISGVCEGFRRRHRRIIELEGQHASWENRAKLEAAIESMSEAVFFTDGDGNLVDANQAFRRRFSASDVPEEAPKFEDACRLFDLDYPGGGSVPIDQQPVQRALRGETATNQEFILRHKLMGESWLASCNFSPIRNGDGAIVGSVVSTRDITSQRQMQQDLRSSEARYRAAFETSQDGMLIFTIPGNAAIDLNPAFIGITGWSRDEVIGHIAADFNLFVDRQVEMQKTEQLIRDGFVPPFELQMRRRNGEVFWVMASLSVLQIDGHLRGMVVLRDINAQRQAEETRRAGEERYRAAFETSFDGKVVLSIDRQTLVGTYIDANERALEIVGVKREDLIGHTPNELGLWSNPADFEARASVLRSQGYFQDVEECFRRPDGQLRWLLSSGTFLQIEGRPCLLVTFKDITLARQAEDALRASEEQYRTAFQTSIDAIVITRLMDGVYLDANLAFLAMVGFEREEVVGKSSADLNVWADLKDRAKLVEPLQRGENVREAHFKFKRKRGEVFPGVVSSSLIKLGGVPAVLSVIRDITDAAQAEQALRASESRYRTVFHTILDPIAIVRQRDGVFLEVSEVFLETTGWNRDEVIGNTSAEIGLWADRNSRNEVNSHLDRGEPVVNFQAEFHKKNGESFWGLITSSRFETEGETCTLSVIRDLTPARRAEAEIRQLSFFDALTGLANRRQLDERLKESLAQAAAGGHHVGILCIDIDNFQTANNAFGHANGDQILRIVAQRIADCVWSSDLVARAGSDEFFVLLDHLDASRETAAEHIRAISEKITAQVALPCRLDTREISCTCSIGITLSEGKLGTVAEMLQQADIAMHQAKHAGRNTFRFFSQDLQEAVSARASMEEDLRQAVRDSQFTLLYQPQVERDRIIGAEALVRWQHPRLGLLSPDKFIPLAEQTGLILALGDWVLRSACAQLAEWSRLHSGSSFSVAVNISAVQLRQVDFVESVLAAVQATGANPHQLKLELTESILAENISEVIARMKALKAEGVTFSIDDFGTGYSSLSYLRQLPIGQLKIDRSFVRDILTDPGSAAIAQTIISLSRALDVPVIAEGVETEEQRGMLAGLGCYTYQGYLFGRPSPPQEIERLFSQ